MKNFLKLSLVFAVVLSTMSARANEDIDFLLFAKKREGKLVSISINKIQEINLSIYDREGNKIFAEKATGKLGIERVYNLEEFPEGKYILEVENDIKKVAYEILITNTNATISSKELSLVYKKIPVNTSNLVSN